jgi:hypothetical protein
MVTSSRVSKSIPFLSFTDFKRRFTKTILPIEQLAHTAQNSMLKLTIASPDKSLYIPFSLPGSSSQGEHPSIISSEENYGKPQLPWQQAVPFIISIKTSSLG